jgi:hypothetical protein
MRQKEFSRLEKCLLKIEQALKLIMVVSDINVASPLVQQLADQLRFSLRWRNEETGILLHKILLQIMFLQFTFIILWNNYRGFN